MDYQECKFYIKYGRCSHKAAPAPEPYHSQCLGKEECIVWNDPIQNQALDADSPIQNAAQELYAALKEARSAIATLGIMANVSVTQSKEFARIINLSDKALAKAEGKS